MLAGANISKRKASIAKWERIQAQRDRVRGLPRLRDADVEMLIADYLSRGGKIQELPAAYGTDMESQAIYGRRIIRR